MCEHIYGSEEVGGTSVFYISDIPFEKLGFTTTLQAQPMPVLTANALGDIPISANLRIPSGLPVIRDESTRLRLTCPGCESARRYCRSLLQIRPA